MKKLEDIASKLDVSISTVSRALSGKPGVSVKKREKIIEFAQKEGFAVNLQARSLRTGKGHGIALISNFNQPDIIHQRNLHIIELGQKRFGGVRSLISDLDYNLDELILSAISDQNLGIILSGQKGTVSESTSNVLKNNKIPLISVDYEQKGFDSIFIDRMTGTYQVARMFLLSGCRYPVYFSNSSIKNPDPRLKGIIKAYKSLGKKPVDIQICHFESDSFRGGYDTTIKVLNTGPVDGIFAYDDTMAIGVLRALGKNNIKVPEEIKVIGFDNIPVAEYLPISLATVAHPVKEVAEAAISLMAKQIENYNGSVTRKSFRTHLIGRESAPITEHKLREKIFK